MNSLLKGERMPDEWRKSVLIPIYKDKGDSKECGNYRGIKLMSHTMKWWERVVEARLRQEVVIGDQQFGFMPRRSTTDAIFGLRMTLVPQTRQTTKCGSATFMLGKNGFERPFKRHAAVLFKVTMGCIAQMLLQVSPQSHAMAQMAPRQIYVAITWWLSAVAKL